MKFIVSPENSLVAKASKLKEKKYRDEYGCFLLEGARLIKDVLTGTMSHIITDILISESKKEEFSSFFGGKTSVLTDRIFAKISDTECSQGIAAIGRIPEARINEAEFALFLDGVRDPGNLGTILRTATAADFCDVYLCGCADPYSTKAVRSSMGGVLFVNTIKCGYETLNRLKEKGYGLLGADMNGEDIKTYRRVNRKTCLVIGGEAEGISAEAKAQLDCAVRLPMNNMESLNAAVSAGALMYILKLFK